MRMQFLNRDALYLNMHHFPTNCTSGRLFDLRELNSSAAQGPAEE